MQNWNFDLLTALLTAITLVCVWYCKTWKLKWSTYRETKKQQRHELPEKLLHLAKYIEFHPRFQRTGEEEVKVIGVPELQKYTTFEYGELKLIRFDSYVRIDLHDSKVFGVETKGGEIISYEFTKNERLVGELLVLLLERDR